jgi:hypothetical protein
MDMDQAKGGNAPRNGVGQELQYNEEEQMTN